MVLLLLEQTIPKVTVGSTYTITPSGWTSDNYDITFQNGTLTVGKATLTVTANNANITFGSPDPTPSYNNSNATITGFKLSENESVLSGILAFTTDYTTSSAVGTSPYIRPSAGTLTSSNYNFSGFTDGAFTILKATPVCGSIANLTATEGETLGNVLLTSLTDCGGVAGSFAWDAPGTSVGSAATSPNGPFAVTFTPTDGTNYNTAAAQISINVSAALPGTGTISFAQASGTYGVAYNENVTATSGFTGASFTWSVSDGALPTGLTLDETATGSTTTISGTPTEVGSSFTFKIKAVDNDGIEGEQQFSIAIAKATPVCGSIANLTATEGETLANVSLSSLTDCGGVAGSFAWDVPGTSVGAAATSPNGPFAATFTPTDGTNYNTAAAQISIDVTAPTPGTGTISFAQASGTYGVAYNENVAATSGFTGASFTWSVSDGALPNGLNLNGTTSTATISGTPTEVGIMMALKASTNLALRLQKPPLFAAALPI